MNVFWHDLRSNRRSTVLWSLSLAVLAVLFLSMFPSFTKDVEASQKILSNLPVALRDALGISLSNFFTVIGFFSYLFTFVSVAGSIQAMNLGVGIVSKEESGKTADFLLTKPISRSSVISQKLLAAVCALLATSVSFVIAAYLTALTVSKDSFDSTPFLLIAVSLFLIQLVFLVLGLLFSVIFPRIKSVISVSLPTVFAFFVISSIGSVIGSDLVRYVTPFKFFEPSYIVQHSNYEAKFVLIEIGFLIVTTWLAYVLFNRKDIRAAA